MVSAPQRPLRTSDLARAVGIHPNTVRLYEAWGLLPPVPRSPNGYRYFSQIHLDQLRLIRQAMALTWMGGALRQAALDMIHSSGQGDLGGALELAYRLLSLVQAERAQAETAALFLQHWAQGGLIDATNQPLRTIQVACLLAVSPDRLRDWERDGLIHVPRDPRNGYRRYGAAEIGRLRVIRSLCTARYSHMAILRMLLLLDGGAVIDPRRSLDTPRPDEDALYATDQLLTTLAQSEDHAQQAIAILQAMLHNQQAENNT